MPSVFDLLEKSTSELNDLFRELDMSYGSLKKHEKIVELADESLTDSQKDLLGKKKSGLIDVAKNLDVESPHSMTKAELQAELLEEVDLATEVGSSKSSENAEPSDNRPDDRDGIFPPSSVDGDDRAPQEGLSSHYDNAEERLAHIREAAVQAAKKSLERKMAFVVIESFQEKDATEPIRIQPAYMTTHPDEIVVWHCGLQQAVYPITSSEKNPVYRPQN